MAYERKVKKDPLKKAREYLKAQVEAQKYSEYAALIPGILLVIFLICNIFYPVVDTKNLWDYWWVLVLLILLSVVILLFMVRFKERLNSLYARLDTWTVYVVNTKIVKFKFCDSNSSKKWAKIDDTAYWYRIITSDWSKLYKSPYYSARQLNLPKYSWREPEYLTIWWKNYHIWDEIVVYVDPNYKNNYIFDLRLW